MTATYHLFYYKNIGSLEEAELIFYYISALMDIKHSEPPYDEHSYVARILKTTRDAGEEYRVEVLVKHGYTPSILESQDLVRLSKFHE